jgi:hypothetical protein
VPPPPVAGATVGGGTVGLGVGLTVGLGEGLDVGLGEGLDDVLGEGDAVAEGLTEDDDEGVGSAPDDPLEHAEIVREASMVTMPPTAASLARRPVRAVVARICIEPPPRLAAGPQKRRGP